MTLRVRLVPALRTRALLVLHVRLTPMLRRGTPMHRLRRRTILVAFHGCTTVRMSGATLLHLHLHRRTAHRGAGSARMVVAQTRSGMGEVTRALGRQDLRTTIVLVHVQGRHSGRMLLMLKLHRGRRKMVSVHRRPLG